MGENVDDTHSLFDFVVKTGNGIKGLVDSGIAQVPKVYIQPPSQRFEKMNPSSLSDHHLSATVPIDLSKLDGPEHDKVVQTLVRAAETLGFFQVINHGVDFELLESLKDAAHRFFAPPAVAKAVYLKGASPPSPLVKYTTSFAPDKEKVLEWRDHISMVYTTDADAHEFWPRECKKEVLNYIKSTYKMIRRLFEILIESLGVKLEEWRLETLIGYKVVNMNVYLACPNPELTVGVGRHYDMGILTVLLQDEIGGLYVRIDEESWIEIPPISGALVINIGDSLRILSKGKYKSAEHKVRIASERTRVLIPQFISAPPTEIIGPFPDPTLEATSSS